MGRRIFREPQPELPAATLEPVPAEQVMHARNAVAELRAVLRTVESADIRETVEFALAEWTERVAELETLPAHDEQSD
jgi:hypothetical protein